MLNGVPPIRWRKAQLSQCSLHVNFLYTPALAPIDKDDGMMLPIALHANASVVMPNGTVLALLYSFIDVCSMNGLPTGPPALQFDASAQDHVLDMRTGEVGVQPFTINDKARHAPPVHGRSVEPRQSALPALRV